MPESRRRRGRSATRAGRSSNAIQSGRKKKTNKWYLGASVLIAVLVIASFAFASGFSGGGGPSGTGSANEFVEGVGVDQDLMATREHVLGPEDGAGPVTVEYSTTPPTSGDHWDQPQRCGFYEEGLADERIAHNLEHGNIVVSYNLPLEGDIQALRSAVDSIGLANVWGIIRFYHEIEQGTVALAAWGVLDTMQGVDRDRIDRFFQAYSGRLGPETFTCVSGVQAPHVR